MAGIDGIKADAGKPPMSLLPTCAIEAEARVLGFGAKKYTPDNWRGGFKWRRLIDAALRHLFAISDGEDRDLETGELHTAHARCCLGFLHEHMERGLGEDDRYRRPANPAPLASTTVGIGWTTPDGPQSADELDQRSEPSDYECERCVKLPEKRGFTFWYIASPYAKYEFGKQAAFEEISRLTSVLMRLGVPCFSPIAHSHPVSEIGKLAGEHNFWMRVDRPFMEAAGGLLVVKMKGWDVSRGVNEEINTFHMGGKPIVFWDPAERVPMETLRRWQDSV